MYTENLRTLAKASNGILIGLTDQGKTGVKKILQFDCSFEE